jgi:hypothetical protein
MQRASFTGRFGAYNYFMLLTKAMGNKRHLELFTLDKPTNRLLKPFLAAISSVTAVPMVIANYRQYEIIKMLR